MLAEPTTVRGRSAALVVARSFVARDETLDHLLGELLLAGPLALLLAAVAGYGLAAAALRPVEAMRARAEVISASTPGARLPEPAAPRRDLAPRGDAERDARPARGRVRARAALRRRRQPRAAHAAGAAEDGARDGAAPAAARAPSWSRRSAPPRTRPSGSSRLAEDLLLIARSDAGELPIKVEPVSAASVLEVVSKRFSSLAEERGRPLEVQPSNGLLLEADPARLEQALGNLVDNALRVRRRQGRALGAPGWRARRAARRGRGAGLPAGVHRLGVRPLHPLARLAHAGAAAGWGSRSSG